MNRAIVGNRRRYIGTPIQLTTYEPMTAPMTTPMTMTAPMTVPGPDIGAQYAALDAYLQQQGRLIPPVTPDVPLNIPYYGREQVQFQNGIAFEVHNAFEKINKKALFSFFKENSIENINIPSTNETFIKYMKNTLDEFIQLIPDTNSRKTSSMLDVENIFDNLLKNIQYTDEYKKLISYSLEYVKAQPEDFKMAYVSNFTYDCAHAYNGDNGMSCAKGIIERFVTSLIPAAMLYIDEGRYNRLIHILTPFNLKKAIMDFSSACLEESDGDENKFRECIIRELRGVMGNSYDDASVKTELNSYIPTIRNLFGGAKRGNTGKRKGNARLQTKKHRKIYKKTRKGVKARKYKKTSKAHRKI